MWKVVLRRFLLMIPQLFILSLLVFILAKFMPGDPFTGMIGANVKPEVLEELRAKAGLNDPWHVQYVRWITNIFKGDFGKSYTFKVPVSRVIGDRMINTFWLSLACMFTHYLFALPLGILSGRYNESKFDKAVNFYNFVTFAFPGFIFYLIMILVFSYQLGWFPATGYKDANMVGFFGNILGRLKYIILPALCYGFISTTSTVQYLRNEIIDAKTADYVRTARSKGVPVSRVYSRHIFRNSLLPIAAFFGFQITSLISGSVFMETIFSYDGMGKLFITSITGRDYAIINALILIFGFMTLLGGLLSDIIMSIVDPRIRIE